MDIFISWSGDRSRFVAESLKDWLPSVIQSVRPWLSASDIEKGARWLKEISEKLGQTNFGIVCLSPENLNEPWILFETGALSKVLSSALVCPILLDLDPSSLKGPLSQFQATKLQSEDMLKLLKTINKSLKEDGLPESQLEETFALWWPKLMEKIEGNMQLLAQKEIEPERSEKDILLEILEIVRRLDRDTTDEGNLNDWLRRVLATLPPREEKFFRMRYGIGRDKNLEQDKTLAQDLANSLFQLKNEPLKK